ncbi:MAG TPA: PH domain-containing protein [Bauldia sp.]|nr:PH domain-containing protein [Bauldia sp.]
MSYVQTVLQPGERVIAIGKLHWIIYAGAIGLFLLAVIFGLVSTAMPDYRELLLVVAAIFLVLAVILGAKEWFDQWITEIAVTNLRVIYKTGFIRRHTSEMNMEKVESVTVNQSLLGRVLGYGSIHVRGTGVGIEHLHRIAAPIELRNAIIAR